MTVSAPETQKMLPCVSTPVCEAYNSTATPEKTSTPLEAETRRVQETFFGLLFEIPVINSTVSTIKSVIPDSKFTSMVSSVATRISDIADSNIPGDSALRKSLNAIDSQACLSLKSMESKYPIITKPTDKLVEDVRSSVSEIEKKYKPLHFIVEKAQQFPQAALNKRQASDNSAEAQQFDSADSKNANANTNSLSFLFRIAKNAFEFGQTKLSQISENAKTYDYKLHTMNKLGKVKEFAEKNITVAKSSASKITEKFNLNQQFADYSTKLQTLYTSFAESVPQYTTNLKQSLYEKYTFARQYSVPFDYQAYFSNVRNQALAQFTALNSKYNLITNAKALNANSPKFVPSFVSSFIDSKLDELDTIIAKKE